MPIDTRVVGEAKGDLLPRFDAVLVRLLRELGDGEASILVRHRRLGSRPAERGAWREDELKIFIRLLVAQDAFGDLQQAA